MEVILKEDVAKLGSRGDVVKVAEGYGRNYLLPRKLAIQADEGNKAVIVQMKAASVRRSAKEKTQAEELAKQFEGAVGLVHRASRASTISSLDRSRRATLADALTKKGFNIDRRKIQLHEPLKTVGRVHGSGEAAQGRDRALESCDREGSGYGIGFSNTGPGARSGLFCGSILRRSKSLAGDRKSPQRVPLSRLASIFVVQERVVDVETLS